MSDLPEIYAVCTNGICNHVWTEPPTRPCPSCGTQMMPAFVDTRDGSPEYDLGKVAEAAKKTGAPIDAMLEQMKAIDAEMRKVRRNKLKQGIENGVTHCPECATGKLREYPGQEEKMTDVLLVCDSPDTTCKFRIQVDRVDPPDLVPHPLQALFNDHSDPPERSD